jgi:heptosyltransferase I
MHILIIKLSSIGDIIHTLPTLAAIKEALPESEISWIVEKRASEILKSNRLIDHLIEIDTKALRRVLGNGETLLAPRQQIHQLRASVFDIALDFQGLFKSAVIARLAKTKRSVGFSKEALREPLSRFLFTNVVQVPTEQNVINKNLALASKALNISVPVDPYSYKFHIAIDKEHKDEAIGIQQNVGKDFAILNPAGGWPTKLWSVERYAALADALWERYQLYSIVNYGPREEHLAKAVVNSCRTGKAYAASLSLKGFYALAEQAKVYIGGDTGPTHLAVAAGAPVVGIFGPTEWWRNGSPYPDDICVERTDITCRVNCHRRSCSNWICMDIEVARVLEAVEQRLQRIDTTSRRRS